MGLLLIPSEVIEKTVTRTKSMVIRQLRGKLKHKEEARDEKVLKNTCLQMSEYLLGNGGTDLKKTDQLIYNMHRSIIFLQKRKRKLL